MKPFTEGLLAGLIFLLILCIAVTGNDYFETKRLRDENLKLDNQIKKYQVGIDSLRYDLEMNFYERRKAK